MPTRIFRALSKIRFIKNQVICLLVIIIVYSLFHLTILTKINIGAIGRGVKRNILLFAVKKHQSTKK